MAFDFNTMTPQQFGTMNLSDLPPLKVQTGGDWQVPEEGVHKVVIAALGEVRQGSFNGEIKPGYYQVRMTFKCVGGPSDGVEWKEWIGYATGPRSRLGPILIAIRGGEPLPADPDFIVKLEPYLNKPFKGVVTVDEKDSTRNPGQKVYFAKLAKASPLKKDMQVDLTQFDGPAKVAVAVGAADDEMDLDDDDDPFADD